jgi:cell volume regulation protein A
MVLSKFIYFDNAVLAQLFGTLALIVILFDGGMQTKWNHVKPVLAPSLTLATLGVILTTLVVGLFAKFILGVGWLEAFLFGSIVGSTDAAAVFAVMGSQNVKPRISTTLEAESGSNDPMAIILTITCISLIQNPQTSIWGAFLSFILQMSLGVIFGLVMGKLAVWIINKINLDSSGLYPVLAMGLAILTFGTTALLKGSGILAVYIMGVYVGNSDLTFRHSIFRFNEGFAWMMQILMFILLGLLVFPEQLNAIAWQGVAIAVVLIFVARPVSVFLSTLKMGFTLKEKLFISWSGLKGAVPIVLATYPMVAGVENSQLIFNIVFFVVLISCVVQGTTISILADKLGLTRGEKVTSPYSFELVSMGKTNSEIIEIVIKKYSSTIGKEIQELVLPDNTLITAVIRDNKIITPSGSTKLAEDDILYILTSKKRRRTVKSIFIPNLETETV